MHAVIQSRAKTAEATAETSAAQRLGAQLLGVVRTGPVARTWRVQLAEGGQGALVVLASSATAADQERLARVAGDLRAAGELSGVLPVRRIDTSRLAYLTDLLTTGTAGDLAALSWSLPKQLEFVLRVVRALDSLHGVGIVHGCLCPANVLLDAELGPVLSEAGMVDVRALASQAAGNEYLEFAAPEIKRGSEPDVRSDVHSAARMLQELAKPSTPPRVLVDIVARGTAPAPELRYASAKELASALEGALEQIRHDAQAPAPLLVPTAHERVARPEARARVATPLERVHANARTTPPLWLGIAGVVLFAGSLAAAALVGGSNDALRSLLLVAAPLGVALATTLFRAPRRAHRLGRLALMLGAAVLVWLFDPLTLAYRIAAQSRMRGDDAGRRAAIAEVMRLGRDFRGLSFAGVGLAGVDLTAADLRGVSLAGADLSGAHLYAAEVYGASFAGARIAGADLQATQLQLADSTGAVCDESTRLPASWRCDAGRLVRTGGP